MFVNKELDKITDILNKFLEPFDCTAFPGSDFNYYPGSNSIEFALAVVDKHADSFIQFAESLHPVHADIFLWSFMHELGHNETEDEFDEEDDDEYIDAAAAAISDEDYYNIPQEYRATDWAGEYMTEHEDEMIQLWSELAPAIKAFYESMEVE